MPSRESAPRVVVAILTYRRPDDLVAVLPEVAAQVADLTPPARILVIDNDPDGGARDLVTKLAAELPVRYVHEPVPGIAAARNRALDESADDDVLVFLDDDERPTEGWLAALVGCALDTGAVGVAGPVISRFAREPEDWIRAGRFFDRRRLRTGTAVELVATNNLALDLAWLRERGIRFDERFGMTGGSDTLFSIRIRQLGGALVWCDEAVVFDIVPESRATREWVIARARRTGNSWARVRLASTTGPIARSALRLRLAALGAARVAVGGARLGVGAISRRIGQQAKGRRTLARGIGLVTGAFGGVVTEYRRTS